MVVAGIDPGKSGAIVFINTDSNSVVDWLPMPLCPEKAEIATERLIEAIKQHKPKIIYIEKVHAIFGSSARSTFEFGRAYQAAIDSCRAASIAYSMVAPKEWQKRAYLNSNVEIIKKKNGKTNDTKAMALAVFNKLYPNQRFLKSTRSRKDHDGAIDALLIARFGNATEL